MDWKTKKTKICRNELFMATRCQQWLALLPYSSVVDPQSFFTFSITCITEYSPGTL